MQNTIKYLQSLILLIGLLLFTACGGGGSNNTQTTAIGKITAFAKDGTPIPSVQDYVDAGVVGVTESNLAEINEIVSNLTPDEVDSKEEIQAITNNVTNVSLAPVAVATASKTTATEGQRIRFSAEGSTDVDGNIVSYEWKEGSKVLFTISVFDITSLSVGKHTLTLTVIDNDGNSNSASVSINIIVKEVTTTASTGITHNGTTYGTVTSPYTGKVWLDRNLGASQVCTSRTDTNCYGDYYQWGRNFDGHQSSTSDTNDTQAMNVTTVGHGNFILVDSDPYDWALTDTNGNIRHNNWSKTDGSSVCPVGFRVPTSAELLLETVGATDVNGSTKVINRNTAFSNFLKLPSAGFHDYDDGTMDDVNQGGAVWTSSVNGSTSHSIYFANGVAALANNDDRSYGQSIRCVMD